MKNKISKRTIGIILIVIGAFGALGNVGDFSFGSFSSALICAAIGAVVVRSNPKTPLTKSPPVAPPRQNFAPSPKIPSRRASIKFSVAGVTYKNDEGIRIQKLIRDELVLPEIDDFNPAYNGLKNKEIYASLMDYGYSIKEVEGIEGYDDIDFIYEPDNPHDSNAIKVIVRNVGHVGYVPAVDTSRLKNFLDNNEKYDLEWELRGGKVKMLDEENEKVITHSYDYGIQVRLFKKS